MDFKELVGTLQPHEDALRAEQVERERALREYYTGRRHLQAAGNGAALGARRWINGAVAPTSLLLGAAIAAWRAGASAVASDLLESPALVGLRLDEGHSQASDLLAWLDPSGADGSAGDATRSQERQLANERLEAAVFTVLGETVRLLLSPRDSGLLPIGSRSLGFTIGAASQALRSCVRAQWLSTFQYPKNLQAIERRRRKAQGWMIDDDLDQAVNTVAGMGLPAVATAIATSDYGGGDIVVKVQPEPGGPERMLTFRALPTTSHVRLLHLVMDEHKGGAWATFVLMVYAAATRSCGLFDFGQAKATRYSRGRSSIIALSNDVFSAILEDTAMWEAAVTLNEPMIVKPENGSYLTIKTRAVTHRRGLRKAKTVGEGSWQWDTVIKGLGETAWRSNSTIINHLPQPDDPDTRRMLGQLGRIGDRPFYMPPYLDFRGRSYYRTNPITYQGTDYQKACIRFDPVPFSKADYTEVHKRIVDVCMSNMMGKPHDKADLTKRRSGMLRHMESARYLAEGGYGNGIVLNADEPYQLYAWTRALLDEDYTTLASLPIGMDGTCNGLQHLSAMFLDETGSRYTNLLPCDPMHEPPFDIYNVVAKRFVEILTAVGMGTSVGSASARRLLHSAVIDRKTVKRAVMTLPYGATNLSMGDFLKEALLEQKLVPSPWQRMLDWRESRAGDGGQWVPDETVIQVNYAAFKDRELQEHPLFNMDCKVAAGHLVSAIKDILPKAMATMDTLRHIGRYANGQGRLLGWEVGPMKDGDRNLRVIQSQSAMHTNKVRLSKLVLPRGIRSLAIPAQTDEMSQSYNSTGIVPNFIHSNDGRHLHQTMRAMYEQGCRSFASVHDCFATSLPWAPALKITAQEQFANMYAHAGSSHPLMREVYFVDPKTGKIDRVFHSWFALADAAGAPFPEVGSLRQSDLTNGQAFWFFS